MTDFYDYDKPMRHHTLDCNEGAIYNGGKCTCAGRCAAEKTGISRRKQDTCVCDRLKKHEGDHKCGACGAAWNTKASGVRR